MVALPGVYAEPRTSVREPRSPALAFHHLLDERLFAGDQSRFADLLDEWAARPRFRFAVGVNAAVVNLACRDAGFAAQLLEADALYADGQSVVWGARLHGLDLPERLATTDLAPMLVERAARAGRRVYFLGAADGIAEEAARRLRGRYPGARIRTHHGFLTPEGTGAVLDDIRDFGTELLFVGLGDPLQVQWIVDHRDELGPITALTCGGLFDWLSERNRRAPRWMIRGGLEWGWRLLIEPQRLWRRYVLGNPEFVLRVLHSAVMPIAGPPAVSLLPHPVQRPSL